MTKEDVKAAVKAALKEEIQPFYVERETHYKHHEFITSWMCWCEKIKGGVVSTVVKTVTVAILALIILGFAVWVYEKGHKGG